jgi:hypothetical protein
LQQAQFVSATTTFTMFRYQVAIYSFFVGVLLHACGITQGIYKMTGEDAVTETVTGQPPTDLKSQHKECPICLEPFSDTDPEVCVDGFHNFHKECILSAIRTKYDLAQEEAIISPEIVVATEIVFSCPMCRREITNEPLWTQVKQEILFPAIEKYIQDGYHPNLTWDVNKNALLHLLAKRNQGEIVERFISIAAEAKLDVDLNAVNSQRWTPLHVAADVGATDVIKRLLAKGANKDAPNDWDWTPLHLAVQSNRIEAMRLLIEQGSNIKAEGNIGFKMQHGRITPLHLAAYFGQKEAMEVLLASKADINAQAIYDFTPLHIAALCSNKAFLKRINSDIEDRMDAEQAKYQACIDVLLKASASTTLQTKYGQTYQALQALKTFDPKLISLFK